MAKSRRKKRPFFSSVLIKGAVLLTLATLAVTAWRVREELVPEETVERIEWTLRPGQVEEQIRWAEERAAGALMDLVPEVAQVDSTRVDGRLLIVATLHADSPLEEGNRIVSGALRAAKVEVMDALRRSEEKDEEVRLAFGVEGRLAGHVAVRASAEPIRQRRPRVALVLDDLGYQSPRLTEAFLELDIPLTTTILPAQPRTSAVAAQAHSMGHEVLLHLPMEPIGYPSKNPGEGAILVDMSESTVKKLVKRYLEEIPEAVGVSNHMGSMATQDRRTMTAVLEAVEEADLYFFDSRTTRKSIAAKIARELSVPCLQNDLFLDHDVEPDRIRKRLGQVVAMAKRTGAAIGIFHPHEECLEAIPAAVAEFERDGIDFVRLSDLDAKRWVGALPPGRRLP